MIKLTLSNLINNLIKNGFISQALSIVDILEELDNDDGMNKLVSVVGLRDEVTPEQPIGGFSSDTFFYR